MASYSSLDKTLKSKKGTKIEIATRVGVGISKIAADKGIKKVVFDRGGFLYHGRVKALADGAREGGLQF
jgi:large subunit ribosomal protein L18